MLCKTAHINSNGNCGNGAKATHPFLYFVVATHLPDVQGKPHGVT